VSLGLGPLGGGTYGSVVETAPPFTVVVTSILPRTGHTAGGTMVEIRGSGFALPLPPPKKGRAAEPQQRVRVLFGSLPAERVEVVEDDQLFCWAPEQDPIDRRVVVTANPTTNRLLANAHGIPNGTRMAIRLKPTGTGAPPVGALPAPLSSRAPLYAVNVTANDLQVAATRGGAPIDLTTAGSGVLELVFYGAVGVTVQNLGDTPAELVTSAAPFAIVEGDDLHLLVGESAEVVSVGAGDVATPNAATAPELAAILNRVRGVRADVVPGTVSADAVRIRTDARGPTAYFSVEGGTAAAALDIEGAIAHGSADLEPIEEEGILVPAAYTYARPDLGAECHATRVLRTLILALRRVVHPNVSFATDQEYDPASGTLVNVRNIAELPAIALTNLRLPKNTDEPMTGAREADGSTPETFLETLPEDLVDMRFTLVWATEDPVEMMNLTGAVRDFFRARNVLRVEGVEHEMMFLPDEQVSIAIQTDNPKASSGTGELAVRRVPVGDIAIEDQDDLPEGVPVGTRYEGVRDIGWTQVDETNLEVQSDGDATDEP
jgi:hypothetical protein